MSDRVEDFEPITAEHAELVADADETKECGVCGGTTVCIGDARYFRWRGELRISEVWSCEDCRTSGNRLLCRETGRVVRLSHVHTGSGFETPDAGGELVADGGLVEAVDDEAISDSPERIDNYRLEGVFSPDTTELTYNQARAISNNTTAPTRNASANEPSTRPIASNTGIVSGRGNSDKRYRGGSDV